MKAMEAASPLVIFDAQMLDEQRYWKARLAPPIESVQLRADHGRTAMAPGAREVVDFRVPPVVGRQLKKLANNSDFLIYTTFMAGLQVTLHKYTGSHDVLVGSPSRLGGTGLGNLVTIRTAIDETASFRNLLLAVRSTLLEAYRHQTYPFARVVKDLGLTSHPWGSALFDVTLSMEGLHGPLPDLDCELAVSLTRGEPLAGTASFSTSVFRRPTIEHFVRNLLGFLRAGLADTPCPVGLLSAVDNADHRRLIVEWNATAADYPRDRRIHELIEQQVVKMPDHLAVSEGAVTLTYRELDDQANRLAHALVDRGAKRGDRVAVWTSPSAEIIVAVLGVLKAGGSYVPVDATWPSERIRWILRSLSIPILLVGRGKLLDLHAIAWDLPALRATLCIDVRTAALPIEEIADRDAVRSVWDFVVGTATDEVGAAGFISSFTGQPFSPAEVIEYRDRVLSLVRPHVSHEARILEIGCGSGLLMFALAPKVREYVGLDPSPATQARNAKLAERGGLTGIRLVTGFADEFDLLPDKGEFDLVLMASTAQFFPGPRYLEVVIEKAMARLRPGGVMVIADVMDSRRKSDFAAALTAFALANGGDPSLNSKLKPERQLQADPQFFLDLRASVPDLEQIDIHERHSGFDNELRFRFDLALRKRRSPSAAEIEKRPAAARRIDTGWHIARYPSSSPGIAGHPDDEAYVIHTSGSTGTPKGVAVQHRPVVNVIDWVNRSFDVGPGDRLLFITSLCFDLSVYDIFGILAAGATIEVASDADRLDPQRLAALIRDRGITFWDSAPAALERLVPLLPLGAADGASDATKTCLRLVFLSGDWIPITLPEVLKFNFPGVAVIALGGATEATIWSNYHRVEEIAPNWVSIPYGRPIQNARYYILDAARKPCPVGIPGDLYIGGEVLAIGYVNLQELTAEHFVPDPFGETPTSRMYKTGDRAVFWEDGTIEFLGRLDQQVKIRGYRVETAEIEAALLRLDGIREAAVIGRGANGSEKRLTAYVVASHGYTPTASYLHRFLTEQLPSYMIPASFVTLKRMPLTANGKVDRGVLPDPDTARPELRDGYAEPATDLERALAHIWKEILKVDAVGRFDNFFELGGNSLQGTQILSRVRRSFNVELSLSRLFSAPRIVDLAATILETGAR